jgi:hypothetical protein
MAFNSTIRVKKGICKKCGGTNKVPLTTGLCHTHYWESRRSVSVERLNAKERGELEPVAILTDDLDIIFSQLIRLKEADEFGMVKCFTCPEIKHWKQMQCGHFVKRAHMGTRYSERNCRPQCKNCNEHKDGNEKVFAEHLEAEEPGLVAMLQEQAREVQGYDRDELKALVIDTTRRVKLLLKRITYQ